MPFCYSRRLHIEGRFAQHFGANQICPIPLLAVVHTPTMTEYKSLSMRCKIVIKRDEIITLTIGFTTIVIFQDALKRSKLMNGD